MKLSLFGIGHDKFTKAYKQLGLQIEIADIQSFFGRINKNTKPKIPPKGTINKSLEQSNSKVLETRPNFKDDSAKNIGNGWTDDKLDLLLKFWNDGLSISKIGEHLSLIRNAVSGKVHRLKLPKGMSKENKYEFYSTVFSI